MDKPFHAVVAVMLSLVAGIAGDILFFRNLLGLSFPLFTLLALAILFWFARFVKSPDNRRNLWVIVPLIFFAAMVAVRADMTITALNVAAVVWLAALLLHYRGLSVPLDQETQGRQWSGALTAGIDAMVSAPVQLTDALAWIRANQPFRNGPWGAIGRGLLIALPVLIVFGLLLGAADVVFEEFLGDVVNLFSFRGVEAVIVDLVVVITLAWLACGALAHGVLRFYAAFNTQATPVTPEDAASDAAAPETPEDAAPAVPSSSQTQGSGMIEATIVLGLVNLMFAVFVLIQLTYFFGGQDNITFERGWTYAQYARRGFFELVAVSVLTLGLILWLESRTVRSEKYQQRVFRILATGIVALTAVMLVSASSRMSLYESAYGFTRLRLYVHVFIFWLAVLYGAFLLSLYRPERNLFSLGVTLCMIGYLVTLNLVNVDYTIARENIERYHAGNELDVSYIHRLSEDAVPAVMPLYLELDPRSPNASAIRMWLSSHYEWLTRYYEGRGILSMNTGREEAWRLLDQAVKDGKIPAISGVRRD